MIQELNGDVVAQIAELAQKAAEEKIVEVFPADTADARGNVGVLIPKTHEWRDLTKEVDDRAERLAPGPRRLLAKEEAETLEGFISLVQRHGGANTAISATLRPTPKMVAYIDYHVASSGQGPEARRLLHQVPYDFPYSERMQAWLNAGNGWKSKRDFLNFVQERIADIVSPYEVEAAADSVTRKEFEGVLRARGVGAFEREEAKLETLFGTPEHLVTGARAMGAISAEEYDEVESGLGEVEIKWRKADKTTNAEKVREFYLVEIPVFEGEAPQVLPARLRASVEKGALFLRLELIGLRTVIERSFEAACIKVGAETGMPVYRVKLA